MKLLEKGAPWLLALFLSVYFSIPVVLIFVCEYQCVALDLEIFTLE